MIALIKTTLYASVLFSLTFCHSKENVNHKRPKSSAIDVKTTIEVSKDSLPIDELKQLSLSELLIIYKPGIKKETFILGEAQTEFRIGLNNFFTPEQINSRSIKIIELTFSYNQAHNITLWYMQNNPTKPIDLYIWEKDAVF